MLKVFLPEAIFPTNKNVVKLIKKLTGVNSKVFTENKLIMEHYTCLPRGFNNMAMSCHKIKYFCDEEINNLHNKCLFLLGEADPMGDINKSKAKLEKYNLEYLIYKGAGHGLNHEIAEEINKNLVEYFM